MLYYRINDDKLYDYSDFKYEEDCLETEIITKAELNQSQNKVIVVDEETEIDVPDYDENGEQTGTHKETAVRKVLALNPDFEQEQAQKEKERIAKLKLTKREVFLALYNAQEITPDAVRAQITDIPALIEFDYATEYYRGNPLIDTIGGMLGYTSEDLDYLFVNKKFPQKEEE